MRRFWFAVLAFLLVVGGVLGWMKIRSENSGPHVELATSRGCYGQSCNGKNPEGVCGDGRSVASKDINGMGLLELRYSRSCKANWGRFTPYTSALPWVANTSLWARVTAWNPGGTSYQTAHHSMGEGSSWSFMTDGGPKACTGVELYALSSSGLRGGVDEDGEPKSDWEPYDKPDSMGWYSGPCY